MSCDGQTSQIKYSKNLIATFHFISNKSSTFRMCSKIHLTILVNSIIQYLLVSIFRSRSLHTILRILTTPTTSTWLWRSGTSLRPLQSSTELSYRSHIRFIYKERKAEHSWRNLIWQNTTLARPASSNRWSAIISLVSTEVFICILKSFFEELLNNLSKSNWWELNLFEFPFKNWKNHQVEVMILGSWNGLKLFASIYGNCSVQCLFVLHLLGCSAVQVHFNQHVHYHAQIFYMLDHHSPMPEHLCFHSWHFYFSPFTRSWIIAEVWVCLCTIIIQLFFAKIIHYYQ